MASSVIRGIEGLTSDQLEFEVAHGGRFVFFQYCVSLLVVTLKRSSDVYFVKANESLASKAAGFSLVSLVLGWWGIPWGPIYTIGTVFTNARGGTDVTPEVMSSLRGSSGASPQPR